MATNKLSPAHAEAIERIKTSENAAKEFLHFLFRKRKVVKWRQAVAAAAVVEEEILVKVAKAEAKAEKLVAEAIDAAWQASFLAQDVKMCKVLMDREKNPKARQELQKVWDRATEDADCQSAVAKAAEILAHKAKAEIKVLAKALIRATAKTKRIKDSAKTAWWAAPLKQDVNPPILSGQGEL